MRGYQSFTTSVPSFVVPMQSITKSSLALLCFYFLLAAHPSLADTESFYNLFKYPDGHYSIEAHYEGLNLGFSQHVVFGALVGNATSSTVTTTSNSFTQTFTLPKPGGVSPGLSGSAVEVDISVNVVDGVGNFLGGSLNSFLGIVLPGVNSLNSLTLAPASLVNGSNSIGTVFLAGPATNYGAIVHLRSSNSVVTVPDHVFINSGASSAQFNITTSGVTAPTAVTIVAEAGEVQRTATLNLTPGQQMGGSGTWNFVAPLPDMERHYSATATGGDGRVFTISGVVNNQDGSNTVWAYDSVQNSWAPAAPIPTSRVSLAAVTGVNGEIYAIGGQTPTDNGSSAISSPALEMYLPSLNTWYPMAPMSTGRPGLQAARGLDGKIYAFGGLPVFSGVSIASAEVYDPATNVWSPIANMPTPRSNGGAAIGKDGKIYLIGGFNYPRTLVNVDVYDPKTNTWASAPPISSPRGSCAVVTGSDGLIYAIGGDDVGGFYTNTVEAFDTDTQTWTSVASMNTERAGLSAALGADGRIYAVGGVNGNTTLASVEAYTFAPPTSSPATDISRQINISRSGFTYNNATRRFIQILKLTNSGPSIHGAISLALDNLVGAQLYNAAGSTSVTSPKGSPYIDIAFNGLGTDERVAITLEFTDPTKAAISYSTRVLAGTGSR